MAGFADCFYNKKVMKCVRWGTVGLAARGPGKLSRSLDQFDIANLVGMEAIKRSMSQGLIFEGGMRQKVNKFSTTEQRPLDDSVHFAAAIVFARLVTVVKIKSRYHRGTYKHKHLHNK